MGVHSTLSMKHESQITITEAVIDPAPLVNEKRRVSFSDADDDDVIVQICPTRETLSDEECLSIWYQCDELAMQVELVKADCRELQQDIKLGKNLVEAHKACMRFQKEGISSEVIDYNVSSTEVLFQDKFSQLAKEKLLKWNIHPKTERGLESMSSNEFDQLRRSQRSSLIYSVLNEQDALFMGSSVENFDEHLRNISEGLSNYAKRFALLTGAIDAMESREEIEKKSIKSTPQSSRNTFKNAIRKIAKYAPSG